jgi:hypothetical protein
VVRTCPVYVDLQEHVVLPHGIRAVYCRHLRIYNFTRSSHQQLALNNLSSERGELTFEGLHIRRICGVL